MSSQNVPSALLHFALITDTLHICLLWPSYSVFKQDKSLFAIRILISKFWHRVFFIFPLKREIFPPLEPSITPVSINPSTPQKTLALLIILKCLLFRNTSPSAWGPLSLWADLCQWALYLCLTNSKPKDFVPPTHWVLIRWQHVLGLIHSHHAHT